MTISVMMDSQNKDPLHGVTLENILTSLVEKYGWEGMAQRIRINCFAKDPSIKSSLTFLRRTPWARQKVERLYCGRTTVTRGKGKIKKRSMNPR